MISTHILFVIGLINMGDSLSDKDTKTISSASPLTEPPRENGELRDGDFDMKRQKLCGDNVSPYSLTDCFSYRCVSPGDVLLYYNISQSNVQSVEDYQKVVPADVARLLGRFCFNQSSSSHELRPEGSAGRHRKSTPAEVWGYGLGFVAIINCISMVGAILIPIMEKAFFKKILMTLVVLGVGAMAGTSILVLIPEMFDLMNIEEAADKYKWKATTLVASLYVFYIWEQAMRLHGHWKREKDAKKENKKAEIAEEEEKLALETKEISETEKNNGIKVGIEVPTEQIHSHGEVKIVAWVVLCADAIHKFVDGLSIGASFSTSVVTGVSVSVAILCEELPHELGDIAILVHSGMKIKKALLYNLLVALPAFAGLVVGILLSEATAADKWIFAIAAGVFMYISLVDILPEIRTADERDPQFKTIESKIKLSLLQDAGLLAGFAIIFFLVTVLN